MTNKASYVYEQFDRCYKKAIRKLDDRKIEFNGKDESVLINSNSGKNGQIKNGAEDKNGINTNGNFKVENDLKKRVYDHLLNKPPQLSLTWPLFRAFWVELLIVAIFRLIALAIQFMNPLILDLLLTYTKSDGPIFEGISSLNTFQLQ